MTSTNSGHLINQALPSYVPHGCLHVSNGVDQDSSSISTVEGSRDGWRGTTDLVGRMMAKNESRKKKHGMPTFTLIYTFTFSCNSNNPGPMSQDRDMVTSQYTDQIQTQDWGALEKKVKR